MEIAALHGCCCHHVISRTNIKEVRLCFSDDEDHDLSFVEKFERTIDDAYEIVTTLRGEKTTEKISNKLESTSQNQYLYNVVRTEL